MVQFLNATKKKKAIWESAVTVEYADLERHQEQEQFKEEDAYIKDVYSRANENGKQARMRWEPGDMAEKARRWRQAQLGPQCSGQGRQRQEEGPGEVAGAKAKAFTLTLAVMMVAVLGFESGKHGSGQGSDIGSGSMAGGAQGMTWAMEQGVEASRAMDWAMERGKEAQVQANRVERLCPREDDAMEQRGKILDWFAAPWRAGDAVPRTERSKGPPAPREKGQGRGRPGKGKEGSHGVMQGEYEVRLSTMAPGD